MIIFLHLNHFSFFCINFFSGSINISIVHFLISSTFPLPIDILAVDGKCNDASNDPAPVDKLVVPVLSPFFAEPYHLRYAEIKETAEENDGPGDCGLLLPREERVAISEGERLGGVAAHVLEHEAELVQLLAGLVHGEVAQYAEEHDVDLADREAELLQYPAEQEHVQRRDGVDHREVLGRVGVDEGQLLVERGDGPDDADRVHGVEEGEHQQFVRRNDLPHL